MNTPIISNFLLAVAEQINTSLPSYLVSIEVAAALTDTAKSFTNGTDPDYQDFRRAAVVYLAKLPKDPHEANAIVKRDASIALGVPGLAEDLRPLIAAREVMAAAEAEMASATAIQGKRLSQIRNLSKKVFDLTQQATHWDINFDQEIAQNEAAIAEKFGEQSVDGCFDRIAKMEILRKLAPAALAKISAAIAGAQTELEGLRGIVDPAAAPESAPPPALARGKITTRPQLTVEALAVN